MILNVFLWIKRRNKNVEELLRSAERKEEEIELRFFTDHHRPFSNH
jgi:hypothetical protein